MLGTQESLPHLSWPLGTPLLLGHPRGFMNCSWPPPGASEPPGEGPQPFGCLRPVSGSTSPPAAPAHSSKQPVFRPRPTDGTDENILWNLHVFIVDFAQPGAPHRFLALQGLVPAGASGGFLPASSYNGALNHLGEQEAIGVAQECPSCRGEGGEDSGFLGLSAVGAFFSLQLGAPLGTQGCACPPTQLLCPLASKRQWPF